MTQANAGTLAVDVAIVGAGPAGLTAGYLLTRAGKSVAIIEKDPVRVGGISRTVEHEGFRFDIGGHHFSSQNQGVVDLWNEILPDDFVERPRTRCIYHEGRFYSYPLRPFEALGKLGLLRAAACLLSYLSYKTLPIRQVRSLEERMVNQFGRTLYSMLFRTHIEKVWGIPCDQISADWAAADGLERSLGLGQQPGSGPAETCRYPRLGAGMMWDAARDRIVERGGAVLMGHALDQLAADGEGGWRLSAKGPDGKVMVRARHAISSAPLRDLAARLHPLPDTTWNASKLKYRDFLMVALKVSSDDLFSDTSIYIHDDRVKVGRVQNFGAWSPEMVPGEGVACVGLEYFCFEGDELWSNADHDLVALATREMDTLGLVPPDAVIGGTVVRQEKACPLYDKDHATNVAALRQELEARYPTLHLVGANGMHRDHYQDHAMLTAMLAVENILAGERQYDAWCVDADAEHLKAGAAVGSAQAVSSSSRGRRAA